MDPFAALGAAAAIAQFVQMSVGLVSSAYDVYKSVSGLPAEDEQLDFVIIELRNLSGSVVTKKPAFQQSDAEKALGKVALKCRALSDKLLLILERTKAKDPGSFRQSAIAALRSKWSEKEKKELKEQADECRNLLQLQLTWVMGSEMIKSLKELTKTGKASADDLSSLQKHVAALRCGVRVANLGPEAKAQLASLFKLSDGALDSITSHRILNSLYFPEMHKRLDGVGNAYSKTFEWIFEDEPQKRRKALEGRMLFTKWLKSGNGIFHIAGKPGAGKSTLMKFLYKHLCTKNLLGHWAAGRKLVLGKFFFWNPSLEMENSVIGLLRTLLYETLEQCPELVSSVFPRQWSQVEALPWQASVELHLDGDEIRDAFNRLIENRNLRESRCFCFFIDGLDEFQETCEEGYKQLTQLLLSWTRTAQGDLKLCVSSREFDVFLDNFSGPQGLKLQDLTYDDIHKFVREKLEGNEKFLELEKPENGGEKLISQVADMADGIFLWVALVVKLLDDACDDEDKFSDLQRKVESTPKDVKDLFQKLFDSIHESDRDQSAQTFAIVLKLLESSRGLRLSLFRYSLLEDFNADPEFALKTNFQELSRLVNNDKNVKLRLRRARKQLYKRCKGLLEVQELEKDPLGGKNLKGTHLVHRVSLAHRSVHEFLFKKEIEQDRSARLQGFDIFGAICQTFVAEVATDFTFHCYTPELVDILLGISQHGSEAGRYINALHNLDRIMRQRKPECYPQLSFVKTKKGPILPYFGNNLSVAHCAASLGVHQYFTSGLQSSLSDDAAKDGSLVHSVIYGLSSRHEYSNQCGLPIVLRWIFQQGCCPNQAVEWHSNKSLWHAFFSAILASGDMFSTANSFEATQIFLEFGANPNISVSIWGSGRQMEIHSPPPTRTTTIHCGYKEVGRLPEDTSDFVSFRGGRATLRDIIKFRRPANVETLLALIDRSSYC